MTPFYKRVTPLIIQMYQELKIPIENVGGFKNTELYFISTRYRTTFRIGHLHFGINNLRHPIRPSYILFIPDTFWFIYRKQTLYWSCNTIIYETYSQDVYHYLRKDIPDVRLYQY